MQNLIFHFKSSQKSLKSSKTCFQSFIFEAVHDDINVIEEFF